MSEQEKMKRVKSLQIGTKVKVRLGDYILGHYIEEMIFNGFNNDGKVSLIHHVGKSRFNPKGRVDNYALSVGNLIFE